MTERRSAASRLLPFLRVEKQMADERMQAAISRRVRCGTRGWRRSRSSWFGHRLQGDNRGRYHALGFVADPDAGLEEGRGFVVDVVAGHVMRELPLERRRDLPTDISALA